MGFGTCKTCAAMREEILFLRSLVRPKSPPKFESLPKITLEADAIINGSDQQMEVSYEERIRQEAIDSERAMILSGQY